MAARPSVKYVVFGGGDDQIPFFRLPDLSLVANETGFAGQFAPNEYQGSLAAGDLLSDDPYLDTQPVPASGQQLFPPNLAGGRLVETAQDITNAITTFESSSVNGTLKSSTGFVSGYDFVADGSQSVANNLTANGVNVRTLDNPLSARSNWGSSAFLAAAFPAGGPANINSWNGHYDNTRMQMANGDILSTSQLPHGLNGGVFFTMGCHAGFQTTDAVVGSTVLDWPQYIGPAQHGLRRQHRLRARRHRQRRLLGGVDGRLRRPAQRLEHAGNRAPAGEAAVLPLARRLLQLRREGALRGRALRPADVRDRPGAACPRGAGDSLTRSGTRREELDQPFARLAVAVHDGRAERELRGDSDFSKDGSGTRRSSTG